MATGPGQQEVNMISIVSYFIGSNGKLWVRTDSGEIRPASHVEWINIWLRDPSLTLALAA